MIKKLSIILLLALITSLTFFQIPAKSIDNWTIIFNPTGTHVKNGLLKIRLDFYPSENSKSYNKFYQYLVDKTSKEYLLGFHGNIDSLTEYEVWINSLPHSWQLTPALKLFIAIDENTTKEEIINYLENIYTPETYITIDNIISSNDISHYLTPYLSSKELIKDTKNLIKYSKVNENQIIDSINNRLSSLLPYNTVISNNTIPENILHGSIDVGDSAINRDYSWACLNKVIFSTNNPANDNGIISTIEVYTAGTYPNTNAIIGTIYPSSDWTSRDYENVGNLDDGYNIIYGTNIDININDYIGIYGTTDYLTNPFIELDIVGGTALKEVVSSFPFTNEAESASNSGWLLSLYGTGTETPMEQPNQFIPKIIFIN